MNPQISLEHDDLSTPCFPHVPASPLMPQATMDPRRNSLFIVQLPAFPPCLGGDEWISEESPLAPKAGVHVKQGRTVPGLTSKAKSKLYIRMCVDLPWPAFLPGISKSQPAGGSSHLPS